MPTPVPAPLVVAAALLPGGSSCQLPAPARRQSFGPTTRRDAVSRRRLLGQRRDVVSCGASASAPAGTLWERVGPNPASPRRGPRRLRQVGPAAASPPGCPRSRPASLPSFRLAAGPPQELSKLGALGLGTGAAPGRPQCTCVAGGGGEDRPPAGVVPRQPRSPARSAAPRATLSARARPPRTARPLPPEQPARPSPCAALRARGCVSG